MLWYVYWQTHLLDDQYDPLYTGLPFASFENLGQGGGLAHLADCKDQSQDGEHVGHHGSKIRRDGYTQSFDPQLQGVYRAKQQ